MLLDDQTFREREGIKWVTRAQNHSPALTCWYIWWSQFFPSSSKALYTTFHVALSNQKASVIFRHCPASSEFIDWLRRSLSRATRVILYTYLPMASFFFSRCQEVFFFFFNSGCLASLNTLTNTSKPVINNNISLE